MFFRFSPYSLLQIIPMPNFYAHMLDGGVIILKNPTQHRKISKVLESQGKFSNCVEVKSNLIVYGPEIILRKNLISGHQTDYLIPKGFRVADLAVCDKYKIFVAVTKSFRSHRTVLYMWIWDEPEFIYKFENRKALSHVKMLKHGRFLVFGKHEIKVVDNKELKILYQSNVEGDIADVTPYADGVFLVSMVNKTVFLLDLKRNKRENYRPPKNGARQMFFGNRAGLFEIQDLEHIYKVF